MNEDADWARMKIAMVILNGSGWRTLTGALIMDFTGTVILRTTDTGPKRGHNFIKRTTSL